MSGAINRIMMMMIITTSTVIIIIMFFTCWPFRPMRGSPNRRTRNSRVPDSFFTVVLGCEPQQNLSFHSHPPGCFTYPDGDSPAACHTPLHILRHSFLSCTLTFASWMFRPFLANISFTPYYHHYHYYCFFSITAITSWYFIVGILRAASCPLRSPSLF